MKTNIYAYLKRIVLLLNILLLHLTVDAQYKNVINYPGGRIAISHDGNNYDKDDYVAAAMNLALLEGTGLKAKLVHFDYSCHIGKNLPEQYNEMLESVKGGAARFNIDTSKIFDVQTQLNEAIYNFKTEAEKSTARNPLWFCIGGPMEVPWRLINAVDPEKRKYIYCISHSSPFNENHVFKPEMTHDWSDIEALGVKTFRIINQNKTEWNTKKENVLWMRDSDNSKLQWLYNRNAKDTYDSSDSGMLWWVITGANKGGNEKAGWEDYKPILEAISNENKNEKIAVSDDEGFKTIFNGKNLDGWYLKIRIGDEELAKKVFAIDDGMIHVFGESFPDEYNLNTGKNDTHGLIYSKKSYSKYILRFEYKWGEKIANNFEKWQYDAGVYYHVIKDVVWPIGIEYQIRYDHTTSRNHTGDLIRPNGSNYDWFSTIDGKTYLHPKNGGVSEVKRSWLHFASPTKNFNALNNKWNQCEIIVMGDQYAIHKLNGDVINMAFNLEPGAGIFGFQSETAEIFYRNIQIKEFNRIVPADFFLK